MSNFGRNAEISESSAQTRVQLAYDGTKRQNGEASGWGLVFGECEMRMD